MALFSDTETSNGNIFTAGAIDLKVDHTKQTYNDEECVGDCEEVGSNLIVNGGFETPNLAPGTWAVYPDASQTSWVVESGAGLEIQDHAAGTPKEGEQLAELDSNNSSAISQTLATVTGGKYRFTFWYSPRPGVGAGDNGIQAQVKVISAGNLLVDDTIGAAAVGAGDTTWVKYTYSFIAESNTTKVMFTDTGVSNSFGGYLDDVSVRALECGAFAYGGTCTLWGERDLGQADTFWNFTDVKPGDQGTNVISLHVSSNDAFVCMSDQNGVDNENVRLEAELPTDTTPLALEGELSKYLKVVVWDDNGDGVHGAAETILYNGLLKNMATSSLVLPTTSTGYLGLAWCAGTQTASDGVGPIGCSGAGDQNDAQTDSFVSDVVFTAVQQRNNEGFICPGSVSKP